MSISSTGLYGSATIVNSDLFTDVETLKETVTTLNTTYLQTTAEHRTDISQNRFDISSNLTKINDLSNNRIVTIEQDINDISSNKIPDLILDISQNTSAINDISINKIPNLILDISKNTLDINDISTNKIPDLILDVSKNTLDINDISLNKIPDLILDVSKNTLDINDISTNKIPDLILDVSKNTLDINDISTNKIPDLILDISENKADISLNKSRISLNRLDIDDISLNKHFIQQLQSVDYRILLANAPSQWPTPPIQTGYNAVIVNNDGINFITQNFGPSSKVDFSLLQINSENALDQTTNIITKGLSFKNSIDNSTQLIINNDGLFILDLSRNSIDTRGTGFQNLNDWMKSVEDALITLGGFGGTGFTWLDLVFGGVGFLASIGAFSYVATLFKSAFIKTAIVSSITAGTDIGNEFKDKFVEAGYTTITEANAENAFKNVSNEKLLAFLWDNYSERTQVINIKKHIENGAKTYFQNIGGTYNVASAVPQNLFRTMFENQCGFKNNVYVPDLFFGAAFVATNVINHNYYPGAFSLNMLKSNVDTINTNVNTLTTNVNNLQVYLNTPPATFNIYIDDADYLGNIYLFGDDRSGTFVYGTSKRLIKVNDGDTVNIFLSSTIIAWTNLAGLTDIAVLITFNGVTNWEAYAGDQRRSTISYTLKSTDSLQIKTGWWGPSINDPLYSGMLDPVNFSIKETINSVYYTKSQIDSKGYLTAIPSEYITETELTTAHYTKTQIDTNHYTKTQSDTNYYTKTNIDTNHYTKTQSDTNYYTKTNIDTNHYTKTQSDTNYYTKTQSDTNYYTKTNIDTNHYTKTQVQGLAGIGMTWNPTNTKFDVTIAGSKWTTSDTEIYYNGKVGIGMTNPSASGAILQINGSISLPSTTNSSYFWSGVSSTFLGRANVAGSYSSSAAVGDLVLSSNNKIIIKSGATSNPIAICVDLSNNIGIGKTNPSSNYILDVSGNINCSGIYVSGTQFTGSSSWTSVTGKPFTTLDQTTYSPTTTQTECEIIMYPRPAGANTLLSGKVWVDNPLKFTPASTSGGPITTYLPPYISLNINTNTLEIDSSGNLNVKSGSLPIATSTILGGVKPDSSFTVNGTSGVMSLSGNDIYLASTAPRAYSWTGSTSLLGRATAGGNYSNSALANDIVLRSSNKLILQSGVGGAGLIIDVSNNIGINTVIPSATLDIVKTHASGTNIDQFKMRYDTSWGLIFQQSFTGTGNIQYNVLNRYNNVNYNALTFQAGNVYIGSTTNSGTDDNTSFAFPDSTFFVRGPQTASSTTNITFRGGLQGNNNGKVKLWLSSDASHSSYIQSEHTGSGNTQLTFGTANGNALPTEKMRIANNGTISIDQILQIGGVNNYNGGNVIKLLVYASDTTGTAAIFKHPNDSQGLGIRYNEIFQMHSTTDSFKITSSGPGGLRFSGNTYSQFFGTGVSPTQSYIYHGNNSATFSVANTYFGDLVCKFNGSTWTTSWIGASSSAKIKKDIQDLDDNECLNKLLALRPVKYRYIDITKNFDPIKSVYGFIAEEVKTVLPEAVNDKEKELIPNIYIMGSVENDILTIEKELEIDVEYTCYLESETIKIKVLQDLSNNNYKIDKTYEIKTDIFVYGKVDDNFHILKKEYFHALTISSVQELHRKITAQQEEINNLKNRLLALEEIILNKNL
jgi:hypothetical protein